MALAEMEKLKPPHRAAVEFYANPANSTTFHNEIRSAQAAGLDKLSPKQIKALFRRKDINSAIQAYAEAHGFSAPVRTADDEESERQDKMLDKMIGLNILDIMEQIEIVRVDDAGNEYIERKIQARSFDDIHDLGVYMKGIKVEATKHGQKLDFTFHDKLAAKKLRDTIKNRINGDGGGSKGPTVNIIIPSLAGQPVVVEPVLEKPDAEA